MRNVGKLVPQSQYREDALKAAAWVKKAWKSSLEHGELTKVESFKTTRTIMTGEGEAMQVRDPYPWWDKSKAGAIEESRGAREQAAKGLIKAMYFAKIKGELDDTTQSLRKAGVTTALGYNFYDLRAPVLLLYPVNVPFRNSIPRVGRVNDGYGTAAHWQATRNVGTVYVGVSEGNRNAVATPDDNNYIATYKQIGIERAVTFSAQFGGEGYADNLADEHLRGLHEIWLGEEGMDLLGNSGSGAGNNGFQLGTPPTPTVAAVTGTNTFGGTKNVSVCVVALTGMGNPANSQYGYNLFPTVTSGLTPSYTRPNADGSTDTIYGGFSAASPMSAVVSVDASHVLNASITPVVGAFSYAWYVNITDAASPSKSNAFLYAITQFASVVVNAAPAGTQNAAAAGLSTDNSAQPLDFDGLLTYAAKSGYWVDLAGGSLTSQKNGRVTQIETALSYFFTNFQAGVDAIWCSPDAAENLDAAIRYNGTTAAGYQIFLRRDDQNNLLGGFVVSAYQSRFAVANPTGANAIPIRIHPMIPPGTIYFDISSNPYPHSRQPYVRAQLVQRDYYSIEWPVVTREWTFGTYSHQVLAHNMPWMCGVITGIGPFVGS